MNKTNNNAASSSPPTSDIDVRYVAHLARLRLTEEEIALFESQLGDVLRYFQELSRLDVSNVEPTAHAVPVLNVFREDMPQNGLSREAALQNAPAGHNGLFLVPKIVE